MRSKSMILILVSLGFGAVAAVGMVQVISHSASQPEEERIPVLVALEDLNIKDELTSENVQVELFPASLVPDGVVTSWEEADGKRILARVSRGMPIMAEMILDKNALTDVEVPPGYKVIAINVDARDSFYGLLKPGHRVDLIAIRSDGYADVAKTFLRNVLVYAVDDKTDRIPDRTEGSITVSTVQLVVNQRQAEAVALYESDGSIRLVMGSDSNATEPELVEDVGMLTQSQSRGGEEREEEQGSGMGSLVSGAMSFIGSLRNNVPATPAVSPNTVAQPAQVSGPAATVVAAPPTPKHTMQVMLTNGAVVNYQWSDRDQLPTLQPTMQNYATPVVPTAGGPQSGPNVPVSGNPFDYVDDGAE